MLPAHDPSGGGAGAKLERRPQALNSGTERLTLTNVIKGFDFTVKLGLNERQRSYILAGGKLGYTMQEKVS